MSIRAVIYARFSSHQQREESIDGQVRACREYAEIKNMDVLGIYADRAISGRTDQRPEFQRMIEDAKRKLFSVVLVWKGDRIARNRDDKAHYRKILRKNGIIIKSVTEKIPDTPEGIILESVLDGMDEYYSANLSRNTKRGMRENALLAKHNGGAVPFGFVLNEDKRYVADPETAPIVTEIFKRYARGSAMSEILVWLKHHGIKRNGRKEITYTSLRAILTNIKYTGLYTFDGIEIEGGCPKLVSEEDWDMTQERLNSGNQKRGSRSDVGFLLSGKCYCGKCQQTIAGDSGTSRDGTKHYYYTCNGKKKRKACDLPSYRKEDLEGFITDVAVSILHDPDIVTEIADAVMRYQESRPGAVRVEALVKRLAYVDEQIDNAVDILLSTKSDALKSRLEKLESEKAEIESDILKAKKSDRMVTRNQLLFWMDRFREGDAESEDFREYLIETFINSVHVSKDKIAVVLNYTDENKNKVTFIKESDLIPLGCSTQLLLAPRYVANSNISLYLLNNKLVAIAA